MTGLVYTNNAQSLLRTAIGTTDTTITVYENEGFLFPEITEEDNSWFPLTLINPDDSTYEIVRATARDGDTITILRAQENTPKRIVILRRHDCFVTHERGRLRYVFKIRCRYVRCTAWIEPGRSNEYIT